MVHSQEYFVLLKNKHFIYGYIAWDIWYRTIHVAKKKRNLAAVFSWTFFLNSSKGSFRCTDRIVHTTAFVMPVVVHMLE